MPDRSIDPSLYSPSIHSAASARDAFSTAATLGSSDNITPEWLAHITSAKPAEPVAYISRNRLLEALLKDDLASKKAAEWEQETARLRRELEEQAKTLKEAAAENKASNETIAEFQEKVGEYQIRQRLSFLLGRVNRAAQNKLLESEEFQKKFLETRACRAFVLSVDIRRSTELMLKAKSPEDFSTFITSLCTKLSAIIVDSFGVFDKFTGDGVLAFFPDFYSGKDAASHVMFAADQCHKVFIEHYKSCRNLFSSVLLDTGLGIGIDYGNVHLVQVADGLTVVGAPVVYACRLSGAPAGLTFLNQPAYEQISDHAGSFCYTNETSLEIKHEGIMLAYEARLNRNPTTLSPPDWGNDDRLPSSHP